MENYRGYFTKDELKCSHCGEMHMDERFMEWVVRLREVCAFPFIVNSGYRCPEHPIEKAKKSPGPHSRGVALDIKASGKRAWHLVREATAMNFLGIGIYQDGPVESRFIHIDMDYESNSRPAVW